MKQLVRNVLICGLLLALAGPALAGERIDLRLNDGSRWRGEVADHVELKVRERGVGVELRGQIVAAGELWIKLESEHAGEIRHKTIFKADIVSIRTVTPDDTPEARAAAERARAKRSGSAADAADANHPGVFVLPLKNTVGIYLRHELMEQMAEEADKYGPGQTIVFIIDSPGGLVLEMEQIHATLMDIKKRHRLVAWIKEAISAACATALHCDEIYFMTEGSAGAMTAFGGGKSWQGEELEKWLHHAGEWAKAGGRSPHIAQAMIHAPLLLSYDKDPETGEVSWYNDLSGEFTLSDAKENLVFTSSIAVHSGFADGIADTEKELAELLDMPKWREINEYGREIAGDWYATIDRWQEESPKLQARLSYAGTGSGDPIEILGKRIQILQQALRWHDRLGEVAKYVGLPPRDSIEREIKQLRKEIADIKKARRGG
ncbi:MAG: Clp protease/crotonase-like domain-containing protein [Planctomycetota bacterium]|jgi:hypothetical protein